MGDPNSELVESSFQVAMDKGIDPFSIDDLMWISRPKKTVMEAKKPWKVGLFHPTHLFSAIKKQNGSLWGGEFSAKIFLKHWYLL